MGKRAPAKPVTKNAGNGHCDFGQRWVALTILAILTALPVGLWASEARLKAALDPLIAKLPSSIDAAVTVYDLRRQRMIYAHQEHRPLRLASVTKVPVSAAALLDLGPDYEFVTTLVSLGNGQQAGTISGLGIIARGDPCLDEHHTERQPDRIFKGWAQALLDAGITRISGDIVIDSSYFSGPIRPTTYPGGARNIQAWYSAPASAFAWNNNCIEVQVQPTTIGQAAKVLVRPRSPRIAITNRATTADSRLSAGLIVSRVATSNALAVSGRYQKATSWFPVAIHEDPDLLAGDHLAALFRDAGITIDGAVRLGSVDPQAAVLHEHRSEIMGALTILNQRSQNFYGEQLIRILGQKHRQEGSVSAGVATVQDILSTVLELPPAHIQLLDGSGLSYDNRSSAWYISQLLARMARHPLADRYRETLREQWESGVRCQVKTGALNVARTLAGYIAISPDEHYAFTILLNRGSGAPGLSRRDPERFLAAMVGVLKEGSD